VWSENISRGNNGVVRKVEVCSFPFLDFRKLSTPFSFYALRNHHFGKWQKRFHSMDETSVLPLTLGIALAGWILIRYLRSRIDDDDYESDSGMRTRIQHGDL
jgi:hypothetical protein